MTSVYGPFLGDEANDDRMEDLKRASLFDLALWSHPAWLGHKNYSLSEGAVTQWIMHHRMWAATKRKTLAELVGSVKGVIPDSKLAKYGDYSYNFDCEDMYRETEAIDSCSKFPSPTESKVFSEIRETKEEEKVVQIKRWMKKVENVLRLVKCVANESCSGDSKSRDSLKLCLRIIDAAKINDSLIDVLDSEDPVFVSYYDEVLKIPTSWIELLSLPQPEIESDHFLDYEKIDALWIKLSSTKIRKLWDAQDKTYFEREAHDDSLLPLMKINFLRRHRESKSRNEGFTTRIADVPNDVGIELLGSLLEFMEEAQQLTTVPSNPTDETRKKCFPEAHGTWTQQLFPRRMQPNCKLAAVQKAAKNHVTKRQSDGLTVEWNQHGTVQIPFQFYMCVPPPNLIRPPPIRQPNMYHHPQTLLRPNNENSLKRLQVAQQVQYKVPTVARMCIPSSMQSQNLNFQSFRVPLQQVGTTKLSPGTKYPIIIYQDDNNNNYSNGIATQNQILKSDHTCFYSENSSKGNEEFLSNRRNKHNKLVNGEIVNNPISQFTTCESIPPNKGSTIDNCEIANHQRSFYQNYIQKAANARNVNQIASLRQVKGGRQPYDVKHFVYNERLSSHILHQSLAPKSHRVEQLPLKPRLFVNEWQQAFQRFCHQMRFHHQRPIELNQQLFPHATNGVPIVNGRSLSAEEKVEKWLETVNMYMKSGSCSYSEELSETCLLENNGLISVQKDGLSTVKHFAEEPTVRKGNIKTLLRLYKIRRNVHQDLTVGATNIKKKKIAKLLSKHLRFFENPVAKLVKKNYGCESKVKLFKNYLADVEQKNANKCNSKRKIRNRKFKKRSRELGDSVGEESKHQIFDNDDAFSAKWNENKPSGVNGLLEKFLLDDRIDFKIFVRENKRFNTFPSKRTKISSTPALFFYDKTWLESDSNATLVYLNYFDRMIDDLFFSVDETGRSETGERKTSDLVMTGGWYHFQLTVKSVLKNIVSSARNRLHSTEKDNFFLNVVK